MNEELQKLLEVSLTDGFITDKELRVLKKKAEKYNFDVEELEVIIDATLYKNNKALRPAVNKCPNCGETLNYNSIACSSCGYTGASGKNQEGYSSQNLLEKNLAQLESELETLRQDAQYIAYIPKASFNTYLSGTFLSVITFGIYPLYKYIIKEENIFDNYSYLVDRKNTSFIIDYYNLLPRLKNFPDLHKKALTYNDDLDFALAQRKKGRFGKLVGACLILFIVGYILNGTYQAANGEEAKANDKYLQTADSLLKAGQPFAAERSALNITDEEVKAEFLSKIPYVKIDSLTNVKDYDGALAIANLLEEGYSSEKRQPNIDNIIQKQVLGLIEAKEFDKARERLKLSSDNYRLEDKVDLAEQLNKKRK